MITKEDTREDYGEQRLQSLGMLGSIVVFMVWVDRYDSPHLISVREATKYEQKYYFANISYAMFNFRFQLILQNANTDCLKDCSNSFVVPTLCVGTIH